MNRIYEELEAIQADAVANTLSAGLLSSYELIEVLLQSCNLSICSFKDSEFGRLKKQGLMCLNTSWQSMRSLQRWMWR
jgi:phosphoribosylaminoimidazole-succinocarboxamide synthase